MVKENNELCFFSERHFRACRMWNDVKEEICCETLDENIYEVLPIHGRENFRKNLCLKKNLNELFLKGKPGNQIRMSLPQRVLIKTGLR